jgi:hypothetical protein
LGGGLKKVLVKEFKMIEADPQNKETLSDLWDPQKEQLKLQTLTVV